VRRLARASGLGAGSRAGGLAGHIGGHIARRLGRIAALAALLVPGPALPCGGFFASAVEVAPTQKIVVVHRAGVERYVFRPHFCGSARDFGVILPIPSALASAPALADNALYDELDAYTAPRAEEACLHAIGGGCGAGAGAPGDAGVPPPDVNVVDRGRVGLFDWVLLQAQTAAAFTDWLDANGFPHGPEGAAAFEPYVTRGWYFVAFKVTADAVPPPAGKKLCGDLGPIELSFAAPRPVVPARIAGVNQANGASPIWRLFVVAPTQQRLDAGSAGFGPLAHFQGPLRQSDLGAHPALRAASQDGEWLTALDVQFPASGVTSDIGLEDDPRPVAYRSTVMVHSERLCEPSTLGCGCGRQPGASLELLLALALLAGWRLRRQRRPERGA